MQHYTHPLDDDLEEGSANFTPVSEATLNHWRQLPVWAQILAVTNFISAGLQLLTFFFVYQKIQSTFYFYLAMFGSSIQVIMIIIFLVSLTFTTLIGWQQWRYAAHLKEALLFEDTQELDLSYYYLNRYFKTLGWMTISIIAVTILAIIMVLTSDALRSF